MAPVGTLEAEGLNQLSSGNRVGKRQRSVCLVPGEPDPEAVLLSKMRSNFTLRGGAWSGSFWAGRSLVHGQSEATAVCGTTALWSLQALSPLLWEGKGHPPLLPLVRRIVSEGLVGQTSARMPVFNRVLKAAVPLREHLARNGQGQAPKLGNCPTPTL